MTSQSEQAFALAWDLTVAGRHHEAVGAYRRGLALDPLNVEGWATLGATFAVLRRPDEAEACFSQRA